MEEGRIEEVGRDQYIGMCEPSKQPRSDVSMGSLLGRERTRMR
jgi:hypothetical protein